jgi:hypothetical protein
MMERFLEMIFKKVKADFVLDVELLVRPRLVIKLP